MAQEEEKISRSRKKQLLARLKEQIQPKKSLIYLAAFLSWIQFLTRITSFALIAKALTEFYEGKQLDLYTLFLYLLALNGLGFGIALFAKQFQGIASQFARNKLKREFFQAFVAKDGEFQDSRTAADILTVAAQGIDSLDTYYSYYPVLTV